MIGRERATERLRTGSVELAKLIGSVAYAALFFAPHAANHAISTTSAEVEVAEFPTEISFYPGGSRLDILNQASMYADEQRAGIGIRAEVTGLPRFNNNEQIVDYFSAKRFEVYLSLADSPSEAASSYNDRLLDNAASQALEFEALWAGIGGLAIYGGLAVKKLRSRIKQLEGHDTPDTKVSGYVAGVAIAAIAASLTVADAQHQTWLESGPRPAGLETIHALDDTSLEGTQIDNSWALKSVDKGIRYASRLKNRRIDQREAYLASAIPDLQSQIEQLPELRDDEELFFVMTDMHASIAGIRLAETSIEALQTRYGKDTVKAIFNVGDMYQATEVQRDAVVAQAFPSLETQVVVTRGNHDPTMSKKWLEDAGMLELDGFSTVNGIESYGRPDVQQTPFLRPSYFPDPEQNETTLGERARTDLDQEPADVLNLHQPAALGAFLGIDSIATYLGSDEDESLTDCDYGTGTVAEFPAALAQAGHWHDQYPLKMVCNQDGTWGIINVQGTGGGANEAPTWNSWSDPGGKPVKTVSYRAFIRNTTYDSITGSIDIQIDPTSTVRPIFRTYIGTEDGAPFAIESDAIKKPADATRINQKNTPR
ncbi:hypothetical protein H7142_03585 [Candidatus Saccharibacteria bacterium]|nr:hypothetical protein [Candidatus Saccharibacteria bacterium]